MDIISEKGVINVGLLVDAVDEVVSIPVGNIEKAPEFGLRIKPSFLSGVGKVDDKFIMILKLSEVINIEELVAMVA